MWTADGTVSERWMPAAPNGRLDGFAWKVPLAEIGVSRPVIEAAPPPPLPASEAITLAPLAPLPPKAPPPQAEPEPPLRKAAKSAARPAPKAKPVEPVIPLVHAPDDPGPDSGLESDPVPEPTLPPPQTSWQRFMQLFR